MTNPTIEYYANGNVYKIIYYNEYDQFHRDPLEGPAMILFEPDGCTFLRATYFTNNKFHNPYGPAIIWYKNDFMWYFNNINYSEEIRYYLYEHNLIWKNMSHIDFDIMWMNIL